MPASEKTAYNMKWLHRVFAVSSLMLLAVTVWMIVADHERPWKRYQRDQQHVERTRAAWELMAAAGEPGFDPQQQQRTAAELERLNPTWFSGKFPWLGAKWLDLPLLDAFNSPVKIDQVWLPELSQDYHHRQTERFDRCITCHVATDRARPGSPAQPLLPTRHTLTFQLPPLPPPPATAKTADSQAAAATTDQDAAANDLATAYGFSLDDRGLFPGDGVSVRRVLPGSAASAAVVVDATAGESEQSAAPPDTRVELTGAEVRRRLSAGTMFPESVTARGLEVGDVLIAVDDTPVNTPDDVRRLLLERDAGGQPVTLTVERGLPQPLASHPRLDLFVGSMSPHPLQDFGCSICHAGQGSATAFDWASHTPNDLATQDRWHRQFGWHPNSHWEWPMLPQRFIESSCVKCHHTVIDLATSDRFPNAPAPQLVAGFQLVNQFGCFGCHEMNGYDVAGRQVGPDLRLEPNDYAVGLAFRADPGFQQLEAAEQEAVNDLTAGPADAALRGRVRQLLLDDASRAEPRLSAASHRLADSLRNPGRPGTLRKVGPSLRHVARKLDPPTLRRWIRDPRDLRPDSRMPQFFGLWSHLDGESLALSERLEPVEILGIATYLTACSQPYDLLTPPARDDEAAQQAAVQRGRSAFQMSGCIACHRHRDFPEAKNTHGPDLTPLGSKLHPQTGRPWLYTWLRDPQRYHIRTTMPNMLLERKVHEDGTVTDVAADITDYLLASSTDAGGESAASAEPLVDPASADIDELVRSNLRAAFPDAPQSEIDRYVTEGIPEEKAKQLNGPEEAFLAPVTAEQKLVYVGRKAIAVHGCAGCHDIPQFEAARPVGPALADWGRKKESLLDCGKVKQYLQSQRKKTDDEVAAAGETAAEGQGNSGSAAAQPDKSTPDTAVTNELDPYYARALERPSRIGFLAQKLREPRSFDYRVADQKAYYSRLQMPQFPFDNRQREQIMTFVLGLVAQPPPPEFVHQPDESELDLLAGRELLKKYNCASCHVLRPQAWQLAFRSGEIPAPPPKPTFPFVEPIPSEQELAESTKADDQGRLRATVRGMPKAFDLDGLPLVLDEEEEPLEDDEDYDPQTLFYLFDLWDNAVIDGRPFRPGVVPLMLTAPMIRGQQPAEGGEIIRLLSAPALERVREQNPGAKGSEVRAWLPPPLIGEGQKVQSQWLYDYLLDPTPIRPAVLLRMPRFPMSSIEAERLARYFAVRDGAPDPYPVAPQRRSAHVAAVRERYEQRLAELPADAAPAGERDHFDDAMRMVVDENYCVKCHLIGDFSPGGDPSVLAPNLAKVHNRLRPERLRRWIADPAGVVPYTTMPPLIPYAADAPHLGGLPQDLYHGTSVEQLDALVDLLMNFDRYSLDHAHIAPLVEAARATAPTESEPDAAEP